MVALFLIIYAVLIILVYFMFKTLKNAVSKLGDDSKRYYVNKLSEYDKLIDDKEKVLNILNEEIKNKKVEAESIKSIVKNEGIDFDVDIIDILSRTKYQDTDILELQRTINEKFNYNYEKIVEEFISKVDLTKNYNFCKRYRKKFTNSKIYEYKTIDNDELDRRLKEDLSAKEYEIYELYKSTHLKFNFDEYLSFLDELLILNDPHIIVYVGEKNISYNRLGKYVNTKYDPTIYKGIKVLFRSKMYDFSLNGRDL